MTAQAQIVGGWTPLHALDSNEQAIFDKVTSQLIGATYKALEVRSQVVNGIKYQYVANQSIPGYEGTSRVAVEVYAPAGGNPSIISITPLLLG
ncbi:MULTISPECIES: hypothetical protein [Pseudomonas]|uniref:hypothetical protein n=1 Tax=Pseudomonas TaxID=286 RepID=UPI000DA64AF6|nr:MULTISPECIES: hypothetical protein [Pseudomonas]